MDPLTPPHPPDHQPPIPVHKSTPRNLARRLETPRTILTLFDRSNPADEDFLLSLYLDPVVQAVHGATGDVRSREDLVKSYAVGLLDPSLPEVSGRYGGLCLYLAHARGSGSGSGVESGSCAGSISAGNDYTHNDPDPEVLKPDVGPYIGFVAFRHRVVELPDVGYVLTPKIWGRGFATEICSGLLEYVLGEMGVKRLCGFTRPGHGASMRVLEKAGLVYVGNGVVVDEGVGKRYEDEMFVVPGMEAEGLKGGRLEGWVLHVR